MKKRKWLSYTIDGILVALIAFFGYIQISMMATKSNNFGVPMAFGSSFLYVSTESMDNPEVGDFGKGSGIIIQKADPASLKVSKRIEDPETGKVDYDFSGDVVTFYLTFQGGAGYPDTHRLIDKQLDPETGKYTFRTLGDNRKDNPAMSTETWGEDKLIGKVVYDAKWFGTLLTMISPDAAASAKKTAWLLPVAVLVPLAVLAILSIVDVYKAARAKEKEEEAAMTEAMVKAGVDLEDGEPLKWKIENSWGDTVGEKGYYVMSATWFDRFVYQAVVKNKYLTKEQSKAAKGVPIHLDPWDPMGTLAD